MARVILEDVSCVFGEDVTAVSHLNLTVEDQEFLVLVGPSGCGKSTTLRMIAGLEEVSSGTIRIGEDVVNDIPPKDRNIAMVFQNYALYPHMTVFENLAFSLEMRYGGDWWSQWFWNWWWQALTRPSDAAELSALREGIPERVRQTARTLGIEPLLDRLPSQLSGGEKQRVALGRAIVRQPAAFLFDEPLSNLDARLRVEMRRELKQLHRRLGATMIYVTHDQVEALTLGDRIAVLDRGILQQVGTPQEVYERPANQFVAGFVGSPPMNFLPGELTKDKSAVIGVRAEDVRLTEVSDDVSDDTWRHLAVGRVAEVESLGDSSLVHLDWHAGVRDTASDLPLFVAKIEGRAEVRIGERVSVAVRRDRLHRFDAATGERLGESKAVE